MDNPVALLDLRRGDGALVVSHEGADAMTDREDWELRLSNGQTLSLRTGHTFLPERLPGLEPAFPEGRVLLAFDDYGQLNVLNLSTSVWNYVFPDFPFRDRTVAPGEAVRLHMDGILEFCPGLTGAVELVTRNYEYEMHQRAHAQREAEEASRKPRFRVPWAMLVVTAGLAFFAFHGYVWAIVLAIVSVLATVWSALP